MIEPWEIYLEYKADLKRSEELAKKQFWMRPFKDKIIVTVLIVAPNRANPNIVRMANKIVHSMCGILWDSIQQIEEMYVGLKRISQTMPTSRIVLKFWRK